MKKSLICTLVMGMIGIFGALSSIDCSLSYAEISSAAERPAERNMYKRFGYASPMDRFYGSYEAEQNLSKFKAPPASGKKANPLTRGLSSFLPGNIEVNTETPTEQAPGAPSDTIRNKNLPRSRF